MPQSLSREAIPGLHSALRSKCVRSRRSPPRDAFKPSTASSFKTGISAAVYASCFPIGRSPKGKESAMRFICIYKNSMGEGAPPSQDEMSRMGSLMEEMSQSGVLKETGGCKPSALGARIRQIGSTATVTDGPFTDAKGIIGGYAIIETSTKADAIGWAKRFLAIHGDGESEVRELF